MPYLDRAPILIPPIVRIVAASRRRASPHRRLAFTALLSVAAIGGLACSSTPDPRAEPPNPGPVTDPNFVTNSAALDCAPDSKGVLHVTNSYGVPLEIRIAQGTGPGVRLAAAPIGGTDVTVEGPADRNARYDVVNPRGRYPGQRLVSVNWRRRSSAGPGTARTIHMDLRCARTSK